MNKFTAIDPAGKTHKRNSKERVYTHTVVALPSAARHTLLAMSKEARAMHRRNFAYYSEQADGTSHFLNRNSWETEEQNADRRKRAMESAVKTLNGCTTAEAFEGMLVQRDVDHVHRQIVEGYYDTYQNMGWCGRADLAAKLKTTVENRGYIEVTILPAVQG